MIRKSGYRFPACAKRRLPLVIPVSASAGEGRSEKIMRKQKAKAKQCFNLKSFRFGASSRKSLSSDLIRGWTPVFRLREAAQAACILVFRFGGRRQVGKDQAQKRNAKPT